MTQEQALQLSTLLYEAFGDLTAGDDVAARLYQLAQLIEANEQTPGGIGDLRAHLQGQTPPRLRIVQ
jgi:hypothetical protein